MPNEVTITISFDSPTGGGAVVGGSAATQSATQPPGPLPLDQLRPGSAQEDSAAPAPSTLESPGSESESAPPAPMPLEELQRGRTGAEEPPTPQRSNPAV